MIEKVTTSFTINKEELHNFNVKVAIDGTTRNQAIQNLIKQYLEGKVKLNG